MHIHIIERGGERHTDKHTKAEIDKQLHRPLIQKERKMELNGQTDPEIDWQTDKEMISINRRTNISRA